MHDRNATCSYFCTDKAGSCVGVGVVGDQPRASHARGWRRSKRVAGVKRAEHNYWEARLSRGYSGKREWVWDGAG